MLPLTLLPVVAMEVPLSDDIAAAVGHPRDGVGVDLVFGAAVALQALL